MKFLQLIILASIVLWSTNSCRSTKKLQSAINKKDTQLVIIQEPKSIDSLKSAFDILKAVEKKRINFLTFSAKIKVQYEDQRGQQPDFYAFVRMYKDSVLWISINATFLNIEAFRILIKKDQIIIINKLNKQVEYHPFSYIEDIAQIPLNFSTLQELIIGNPIYTGGNIVSFRQTENHYLIGTAGDFFKNLLTISADNNVLERSKLDDIDVGQNRTADLTYGDYEQYGGFSFATYREITVAEKTKVDINLSFKQFEFNKELSFPFNIPRNYKTK